MRIARVAIAVAALAAAGCDRIPGTDENAARSAMARVAFDPGALKMTYPLKTAQAICGFVNGKNRMGAYTGEAAFIYDKALKELTVYSGPSSVDDYRMWSSETEGPRSTEHWLEMDTNCRFPAAWRAKCGIEFYGAQDKTFCDAFLQNKASQLPGASYRY